MGRRSAHRAGEPHGREHVALGAAIREVRARRGLSQEELGEDSGLHRNYVGAIERGEINATFKVLRRVATGLRMPLSELMKLYELRRSEIRMKPKRPRKRGGSGRRGGRS